MPERAISCWTASGGELQGIVSQLPNLEYAMLERRFVRDPAKDLYVGLFDGKEDVATWDEGRLFGVALEIHWVRHGQQFQVVLIGDIPPLKDLGTEELSLESYQQKDEEYLLWGIRGEQDPGLWWETRIPRDFHYPIVKAPRQARAQLVVRQYFDRVSGELQFWRCLGFSFA